MDEKELATKLGEIISNIGNIPVIDRDLAKAQKQIDRGISEVVDQIRLLVKYLVFDLEATKRENAYLRKVLEEKQSTGEED